VDSQKAWQELIQPKLQPSGSFEEVIEFVVKRGGPTGQWDLITMPEGPCLNHFDNALRVACGDWNHPFKLTFLDWSVESAQKALDDPRFDVTAENSRRGWKNSGVYPGNKAMVLSTLCLAKAMRTGHAPDRAQLHQAAEWLVKSHAKSSRNAWSSPMVQGAMLKAVRLFMLAGDMDAAKQTLQLRDFTLVNDLARALANALDICARSSSSGQSHPQSADLFEATFAHVCAPDFAPPKSDDKSSTHVGHNIMVTRLELGMIKYSLLLKQSLEGNWQRVFERIVNGR
jgi:hypothetical protein